MKNKETGGDTTLDESKEEIIYRVEVPANRYGRDPFVFPAGPGRPC